MTTRTRRILAVLAGAVLLALPTALPPAAEAGHRAWRPASHTGNDSGDHGRHWTGPRHYVYPPQIRAPHPWDPDPWRWAPIGRWDRHDHDGWWRVPRATAYYCPYYASYYPYVARCPGGWVLR
jgi:hypothetical protein